MSAHWNPEPYLRYGACRARPADDLIPRITLTVPGDICDLGCGSGILTARLRERWPDRRIVAVDGSAAMLAHAVARFGDSHIEWVNRDIAS